MNYLPDDGKRKKGRRTAALLTRPNDFTAALRNQGRRFLYVWRRVIPGPAAQGGSRRESSNM